MARQESAKLLFVGSIPTLTSNLMKSISGKQISREDALKGLGNPSKWEAETKKTIAEFKRKPLKQEKRRK